MKLKTIIIRDYSRLFSFWKDNYFVNELDTAEKFKIFLEKNPRLSILIEENGKIVGAISGSFDGEGLLTRLIGKTRMNDLKTNGIHFNHQDGVLLQRYGKAIPFNVTTQDMKVNSPVEFEISSKILSE